jgi:hypothetical protein
MSNKTAGYAPYDHPLPYVMVESSTTAHDKGDLVQEGKVIGFTETACAITKRVRLDTEIPHYATKKTKADTFALGDKVEMVDPGEGETSGTVQALDQGVGFATVIEASTANDETVLVQPDRALYL